MYYYIFCMPQGLRLYRDGSTYSARAHLRAQHVVLEG